MRGREDPAYHKAARDIFQFPGNVLTDLAQAPTAVSAVLTRRQHLILEKKGNKTRSKVRVRVEHVFGAQSNDMGGPLIRSIGLVRAKARIGLRNLACNMRRAVQLDHLDASPG